MLKSYSTPLKGQTSYSPTALSSSKKHFDESSLKSLELQALSLIDSDIATSKILIEDCLRIIDEEKISIIENM